MILCGRNSPRIAISKQPKKSDRRNLTIKTSWVNLDASQVAYDLSFKVRQTAERSNTKSTHIEVPSNSSPTHQSIMLRPSVHQIQISTSSDYLIIKYYQAITCVKASKNKSCHKYLAQENHLQQKTQIHKRHKTWLNYKPRNSSKLALPPSIFLGF